ncbi:hypothetical protein [Sphingopyxis granuli]|uniref:hypothetical protein n=1 Tax=Sphingopyxis granuli TaxID=267128 RepID=UPI000B332B5E|nr:hypothetical protein [Sphingopyxis granuli]
MAYLIGFLMTLYPYAHAAMMLTSQAARDHFAGRAGLGQVNIHALMVGAKRHAARKAR